MRIALTLTLAGSLVALALPATASAVVGGTSVQRGGYPFVVAVGDTRGPDCGGTLIAANVVLTAAHCVADRISEPDSLRVLVGSPRISADGSGAGAGRLLRVSAAYVHPKFDAQTMHYDAALLILEQPASGVRTLPMAASSPLAGSTASAAGWGMTHEGGPTSPDHLRSVVLKIGTQSTCGNGNAVPGGYFAPSMLCAGNPGRDTCSGDSGGPLVGVSNGHLALLGITSFGYGCAQAAHPGVYTRVSAIRGWALAQLARHAAAVAAAAVPAEPSGPLPAPPA